MMTTIGLFPLPRSKVPPDAGVTMPPQDLWERAEGEFKNNLATSPPSTWLARLVVTVATLAMTGFFAHSLYSAMAPAGIYLFEGVFLVLATACFIWVSVGASAALLGFVLMRFSPAPSIPVIPSADTPLTTKTALLFPVYHECPARIAATIEALAKDLSTRGYSDEFSVFVLSDTRPGSDRKLELETFEILKRILAGRMEMFYRYREENVARKSGNIQDWIICHGGEFDQFVIFDADSVMSADILIQLAAAMELNPCAGLIQTVPRLTSGLTTFARLQQFANAAYGPILARGLAAWSGQSANYWGHNAIIRTLPFANHAGLPKLDGAPPFGGHIQSHDFVEAALLRRAGWAVYMAPQLSGSYESSPPTSIDMAIRDRRWVQGNLQHLGLVTARGLTLTNRVHLFMGAYAYLISGLWLALMLVGIAMSFPHADPDQVQTMRVDELLFGEAWTALLATVIALFLPKVLGLLNWLLTTRQSLSLAFITVAGSLLETVLSVLLAPIRSMTHLQAIVEVIRGRDSGWSAQRREAEGVSLAQAMRFHALHVIIGLALAAVSFSLSWWLLAWMSPVAVGFIVSPWVTWLTSRRSSPAVALLLATDEDLQVPAIVRKVETRAVRWQRFCRVTASPDATQAGGNTSGPPASAAAIAA